MFAIDLARARRLAFSVVLGQAAVTVVAALIAWGVADERAGLSALAGGGIATVASLAMAVLVFGRSGGAERALAMFYVGEAVKVLVVIALFVVVLKVMRVAPLAMFAAFAVTFLVYWIALVATLPSLGSVRRGA